MEEFKTAHSKMFNRLRQTNNNNNESRQQQASKDSRRVYDEAEDDGMLTVHGGTNDHNDTKSSSPAGSKISNGNVNLAIVRPMPTVATN